MEPPNINGIRRRAGFGTNVVFASPSGVACLQSSAELGRRGRQKPITEAPAHARVTPSRTVMRGRALVGLELFAQARSQAAIGPEPKCASDARGMKDGGFFGGRRWE